MSSNAKPSTSCQALGSKISETTLGPGISFSSAFGSGFGDYNPLHGMLLSMFDWWRRLSRAEVIAEPFPAGFREHVLRRVPCAELLTEDELAKLETLVRIFNSEKTFEAAGGLELTEEMRVTVAARA